MTLHAPQSIIPKSPSRRSVSSRRSSRRSRDDDDDDNNKMNSSRHSGYSSGSLNASDYFSDNLEDGGRADSDDDAANEQRGRRSSKKRFPSFLASKGRFLSRRNGDSRRIDATSSETSASVNSHNRESFLASRRKDNLFQNYAKRIGGGLRRRSLSRGRGGGEGSHADDGEGELDSRGHAIQIRPDDVDDGGDAIAHRRPRSDSRGQSQPQFDGHFRYGHPQQQRYHGPNPFVLTSPRLLLSPRADLWMALAFASCAAISSMAMARGLTARSRSSNGSALDKLALSVCALSFGISLVVAVGFRYGPLRGALTRPVGDDGSARNLNLNSNSNAIYRFCRARNVTPELLLLSLLSILWLVGIPIIADGSPPDSPDDLTLAVAGTDIWNANLFYSSWASSALVWYLLVEVVTLADRRGVVERYLLPEEASGEGMGIDIEHGGKSDGDINRNNNNILSKRWSLLLLNSFVILSSSVNTFYGPMCQGMLSQTDYCQRGLVGIVVGGVFTELLVLGVAVLFRLSHMTKKTSALPHTEDDGRSSHSHPPQLLVPIVSKPTLHKACSLLSFFCLLFQSINVALMTSPTGGGPATNSGTTYFASWVGFLLAFELGLRYLEWFTSAGSAVGGPWARGADGRSIDDPNALPTSGEDLKRLGAPANSSDSSTQSSEDEETAGRRPVAVLKTNHPHDVKSEASLSNCGFSPPSVDERPGGLRNPRANIATNNINSNINKNEAVDPYPDFVSQTAGQGSLEPEAMSYQNLAQRSPYSRRSTGGTAAAAGGGIDAGANANASQASRSTVQSWNPGDDQHNQQRSNKSSPGLNNPSGYISRQKSIHYNDIHVDDDGENHSQVYYGAFPTHNAKAEELDHDPQITRSRNQSQTSSNNNANTSNNLSPLHESSNETSHTDSMVYNMMNNDGIEIHPLKQPSNDGVDNKSSSSAKRRHSRKNSSGGESVKSSKSNRSSKSSSSRDKDGRRRRRSSSGHKKSSVSKASGSMYSSPESMNETVSSGSNPPPTIASEYSSQQAASRAASRARSNVSGTSGQGQQPRRGIPVPIMSSASAHGSREGSNSIANSSGPPPPPFQRSPGSYPNEDMDASSQFSDYLNSIPMASINTNNKSPEDSGTIVSDTTTDAHFDPPAAAANTSAGGVPRSTGSGNTSRRKNAVAGGSGAAANATTGSHSTSSSQYRRTSSDENPSSGADHEQVDDIVKAALAYAEQSHGDEGVQRTSSARQEDYDHSGFNQESIHSFYSDSNKRMPPPSGGSGSKNNRSRGSHASADVNNLVKQALSQAGHGNRQFQPPARPQNTRQKSLYDAKSVTSMYSEATDITDQEAGQHFDC